MLDLILFLGECSSNGKVRDLGQAALFLSAVDFFFSHCVMGVKIISGIQ